MEGLRRFVIMRVIQELQRIPVDTTILELESAQKVMKLIDKMEEDDDVNAVYHNLEITEELIKAI